LFAVFLCSCVGATADIALRADGSGEMVLEYRVSRQFQAIGALDGNARWPTVPVGRADIERSVERLNAGKLLSFSAKEEGQDLINRAVIGFSRLEDILPLLGSGGESPALTREGGKQILRLRLGGPQGGSPAVDPQLLALAEDAARGYRIGVSLSAPAGVELRLPGGEPAAAGGEAPRFERSGKKAGFSIPLFQLISPGGALAAEFVF
jgi:hypothetical protein